MKPANLLVFRTQHVKLGDLGISVKMDSKDVKGDINQYYVKGTTPGFVTPEVEKADDNGDALSK